MLTHAYEFHRIIKYNYKTLVCRALSGCYVKVYEQNGLVVVIKFNTSPEEELLAKVIQHSKCWGNVGSPLYLGVLSCGEARQNCGIISIKFSNLFMLLNCPYYILIRSNKMQQYAGIYLLQNQSTHFGCPSHPSSGIHKTLTAASGTGHSI